MHYRPIDLYIVIEYYDDMYTNILLLLKWKIKYNNDMYTLDITWTSPQWQTVNTNYNYLLKVKIHIYVGVPTGLQI